jgi:hypothetical protein
MFRTAIIPVVIMFIMAILSRISLTFASELSLGVWLVFAYIIVAIVVLCICAYIGFVRFYKSLYTGEGYMTLSLPVSADQLIVSKLISGIIVMYLGIIVVALSTCIFFVGTDLSVIQVLVDLVDELVNYMAFSYESQTGYLIEMVIYAIVSIPLSYMLIYAVLSIAQLVTTKNRLAIAIVIFIVGAIIWNQINLYAWTPFLKSMTEISIHLYIWIRIVATLAVEVACYFVTRYIIKNKVNLIV